MRYNCDQEIILDDTDYDANTNEIQVSHAIRYK